MFNGHLLLYLISISLINANAYLYSSFPYYCDVKEIELIRNPKSINRLLIEEDTIFLIFKEKIIGCRVTDVINNNNIDLFLVYKQPFVLKNKEKPPPASDLEIKGYFANWYQEFSSKYDYYSYSLDEIYQYIDHYRNETFIYELDFDKIPGERGNNRIVLYPAITNFSFHLTNDYHRFEFDYDKFNLDIKVSQFKEKKYSNFSTQLSHQVRRAVFYSEPRNIHNNYLIELDFNNNLHFSQIEIKIPLSIQGITRKQVTLDKFLSCYQPFKDFDQLKGIYYDKKTKSFYLFVNRFYILIKYDLVKNEFRLNQSKLLFFESAYNLSLRKPMDIYYEYSNSKWIKKFEDKVYLSLYSNQFEILISDEMILSFGLEKNFKFLKKCRRQILNVRDLYFCIEEKTYYQMSAPIAENREEPKMRSIKDLFDTTPIEYEDYQIVELIFDYKDDTFVLMTQTHLFIIDNLVVDVGKNQSLIFKYDKTRILRKLKNCILPNNESKCNKDNGLPNSALTLVINIGFFKFLAIFFIVVLLVCFVTFLAVRIRKKNVYIFKKKKETRALDDRELNERLGQPSSEQPSQFEQFSGSMFNQLRKDPKPGKFRSKTKKRTRFM